MTEPAKKKKLPHCRFCSAKKPEIVTTEFADRKRYHAECKCGAHGKYAATKDAALASWSDPWQHKA